ncbi:MAG: response regulator [Candidatus Eisenbacteria bacterium]
MEHPNRTLEAPNPARPGLGTLRLLVVDDDPEMRRYLKRTLERASAGRADVRLAADGLEALAMLEAERFDLLVADVRLPGLDGLALCRAMAGTERNGATPVLLVTGDPEVLTQASAFVAGRRDRAVLAKPFNAARLVAALARLGAPP